jgi:hypothetical protein
MKTSKKVLSIILAIMMVISIIPLTASAATSGTCGDNLTWTFDKSTGTLTISGTGAMYDYDWDDNRPWKSYVDSIKTVVINKGVTTIGDYAFASCNSLTSVTIPDSVTTIGDFTFWDCYGLENVTIPYGVKLIGEYCFYGCEWMTDISLPNSIMSIGSCAFLLCCSLTNIRIPDSVTEIGCGAFNDCINLESVTIGKGLTIIDDLFIRCKSLKIVTIPDSVTTIGDRAFESCDSLTDVYYSGTFADWMQIAIGDYNDNLRKSTLTLYCEDGIYAGPKGRCGENVFWLFDNSTGTLTIFGIGAMYDYYEDYYSPWCHSDYIKTVVINNGVTTIGGWAFERCTCYTSVTIPDSVTTIGEWAFWECNSLTDVYYSGTEEQWNEVNIDDCNNDPLLNATIHFNSCEHMFSEWNVEKSQTCIEKGIEKRVCSECGKTEEIEIPATGHDYKSIVTPPTCTDRGYTTHTCVNCGDTYVDNYVDATGHKYNEVITQSTCEQNGYTTCICECGDSYISNIIAPTGHADNDKNGYCDICDELLCDHDCHRGGFAGFLWKITNFFNKLFRTKQYCECGVAHY